MRDTVEVAAVNEAPARATGVRSGRLVLEDLAAASERAGLDPLAERLRELRGALAADVMGLERALSAVVPTPPADLARAAARHLLAKPGKRVRPMCVFLAARLGPDVGPPREVLVDLAVASELVHAATLLHDDVIDLGDERRGSATARVVFGNPASVLGGDQLLIDALRHVGRAGIPGLMSGLFDAIGEMIAGEAAQLVARGTFTPDRETYQRVVDGKTSALFSWALVAGGTAGGLGAEALEALAEAGRWLGLAFQLVDDTLDLADDASVAGKDRLKDLAEGKLTWPLILACERDAGLLGLIGDVWRDPTKLRDAEFAADLVSRIRGTGAVTDTQARARVAADRAREALETLPAGPAREALCAVVHACVERAR